MPLTEGYVYTAGGTYVVQSPILAVKITTDWTLFSDDTENKTYKATARIYNGGTLLDSTIDVFITEQETAPDSLKDADRNVQLTTLLGQNRYVIYSLPKNLTLSGEDAVVVSQTNETFSFGLSASNSFWDDVRTEIVADSNSPLTITSEKVTSVVENIEGTDVTVPKNILKYTVSLDSSSLENNYYNGTSFESYCAFATDSHFDVDIDDVTIGEGESAVDYAVATINWKGLKTGTALVENVSTPIYSDEIEQGYGLVFEQTGSSTKISVDANIIPEIPSVSSGSCITITKSGNDNKISWDGLTVIDKLGEIIDGSFALTGGDSIEVDSDGETATISWRGFLENGSYATELVAGSGITLNTENGQTTISFDGAEANSLLTSITLTGDDYITASRLSSSSYKINFEGLKHGSSQFVEVAASPSSGITLDTTDGVLTIGFDQTLAGLPNVEGSTYITSLFSSANNEYTISWKGFDVDSTSGNSDGSAFSISTASNSNLTVETSSNVAVFDWKGFNIPNSDVAKGLTTATNSGLSLTKIGTNAVLDWDGVEIYVDGSTAGTYDKWSSNVKGIKAGSGVSIQVSDGIATLAFAPAEVSEVYGASVSAADSYVSVTPSAQTGYKEYSVKWNGFQTNSTTDSSAYVRKIYAYNYLSIVNDTTNDKATISWKPVLSNAITEPVLREKVAIGLDDGSGGYDQTTQVVTDVAASSSDSNFLNLTGTIASQTATVLTTEANEGSVTSINLTSDSASVSKVNGVASTTNDDALTAITSSGTVSSITTTGTLTDKQGYIPGGRAQAITAESALDSTSETYQTSEGYVASSYKAAFTSFTAPSSVSALTSSSMLEQTNVPSSVTFSKTTNGAIANITSATANVPKLATATLTTTNSITALTGVDIIPHVVGSVSNVPANAMVLDTIGTGDSQINITSIQFVTGISCVNNQIQCVYGYLYFTKSTQSATFKGIDTSISSPSYVTGFTQNPSSSDYESFGVDSFVTTTTDVVTDVIVGNNVAVAIPSWSKTNNIVDGTTDVSAPIASDNFGTDNVLEKPTLTSNVVTSSASVATGKTFVTGYDTAGPTKEYFGTVAETTTYHVPSSSAETTTSTVNTGYTTSAQKFITGVTGASNLLQTSSSVATESVAKAFDSTKTASVLIASSITKQTALTSSGTVTKKSIVYDKTPIDSKLSDASKAPIGTTTTNENGGIASGTSVDGTATALFPNS